MIKRHTSRYAKRKKAIITLAAIIAVATGVHGASASYTKLPNELEIVRTTNGMDEAGTLSDGEITDSDRVRTCSLSAVVCDGEKKQEAKGIIGGHNITSYATNPKHEETVKAIYDAMPEIKDKFDADAYIKARRPESPVRGGMVERASMKYDVDMKLVLALMQNDSSFGTAGLGARTRNPGNIANRDDGHTHTYPSWEAGVEGVARWVSNHKQ